jgi:hypothetical protein
LRNLATIFAVLCCMSALALAQGARPQIILLHPGYHPPDTEAIVIPGGSPVRLVSFPRDFESHAAFRGRFTLSGNYVVGGYGDDADATLWPDRKFRDTLPCWRDRGGPHEIYISNAWAFAQAVAPKNKLQDLKAKKLASMRGHVTIIADDYKTSIECDVASFSARFVSVVKPAERIAANPKHEEGC